MIGLRRAGESEICIVDDRALLLGLDGLYREAMKVFEASELLSCAQRLTQELGSRRWTCPWRAITPKALS